MTIKLARLPKARPSGRKVRQVCFPELRGEALLDGAPPHPSCEVKIFKRASLHTANAANSGELRHFPSSQFLANIFFPGFSVQVLEARIWFWNVCCQKAPLFLDKC